MEYLKKEDFILINRLTVERHGGNFVPPFNFLNENSLDYLIEAVEAEMFGEPLYPEIGDKAAVYMFSVITGHIFQDGNKRTGLEAALLFLRLNGFRLIENPEKLEIKKNSLLPEERQRSNEILFEFTMSLASGKVDLDACRRWFKMNIEKRK